MNGYSLLWLLAAVVIGYYLHQVMPNLLPRLPISV